MLVLAEMILLLMALAFAGYLIWKSICRAYPCPAPLTVDQKAAAEIKDKKEKLLKAMDKIALLAAEEKDFDEQIEEAQREAAKWKAIQEAVVAGTNPMVPQDIRGTVRKRLQAEQKAEALIKAREALRKTVSELRAQLDVAQQKIDSSATDVALLSARLQTASAREEIAGDLKSVSDLETEADKAEGRASANEEIDQFQHPLAVSDLDVESEVQQILKKRK